MPPDAELRAALHALMQRSADHFLSDDDFNALALRVFEHQFELNPPYRRYCERRGHMPASVRHWRDIPAVPTAAFKETVLVAGDAAAAKLVFRTSGTTRGTERRGTHYILDPTLYDASLRRTFEAFVLPDHLPLRMIALVPASDEQPESSLSYMITALVEDFDDGGGGLFASVAEGLALDRLLAVLNDSIAAQRPVCLLGTSLAFVHLFDRLGDKQLKLPAGSRLMDTGGFKGEKREVTAQQLHTRYELQLGVPERFCINEYGMTELCSQYYDASLTDTHSPANERVKRGPTWLRARVVDPDSLLPVQRGQTGILQHFDLANLDSVSAVLTEDLGYELDDGFVLLGRAPGATPRGCSIAMDIMLSDSHRQ